MFRGKRLALLVVGLVIILAAALYGLTRTRHATERGPYGAIIERLHEINHEMRDIHHSYRPQHAGEEAFERWHDLLHEERELLHSLPGALEGVTPETAGTHDTLQESTSGAKEHEDHPRE